MGQAVQIVDKFYDLVVDREQLPLILIVDIV